MYRVLYYTSANDKQPKTLHEPYTYGNKVISGEITQVLDGVDTFEFAIAMDNSLYQQLNLHTGLIKVINLKDQTCEFYGRILQSTGSMSSSGAFDYKYICESMLSYFHDSAQHFAKIPNRGAKEYFRQIINVHNGQVEPHKRFRLGTVTMTDDTNVPHRYIGYDTTYEAIKDRIRDRIGGHVRFRFDDGGLIVDWVKDYGKKMTTPIKLGENMQSAKRDISLDGLITRIVPIGADLEDGQTRDEDTGQFIIRERVDIRRVNGGRWYLEDPALVKVFGIIQQPVHWPEINSPHILKIRGQQYLDAQKASLASWDVDVLEMSLIDDRHEKYEVGNHHPIINSPLSGVETLQIIEKTIDILQPQKIKIKVGADQQTLTSFQLQQREARQSIEAVASETARRQSQAEQQWEKEQEEIQRRLEQQQEEFNRQRQEAEEQTRLQRELWQKEYEKQREELNKFQRVQDWKIEKNELLIKIQSEESAIQRDGDKIAQLERDLEHERKQDPIDNNKVNQIIKEIENLTAVSESSRDRINGWTEQIRELEGLIEEEGG